MMTGFNENDPIPPISLSINTCNDSQRWSSSHNHTRFSADVGGLQLAMVRDKT